MSIRRGVRRAKNEWQSIRIGRSLVRYKNKSITSQITAFGRPLYRSSTGECHLIGYLVCTNTLCSIIRSLYAAVSVQTECYECFPSQLYNPSCEIMNQYHYSSGTGSMGMLPQRELTKTLKLCSTLDMAAPCFTVLILECHQDP